MCDTAGFFGKIPHRIKSDEKWPKSMVFELCKKIMSLVLSGMCVKSKFIWFIKILQKLHAWEKSSSRVNDKNDSANEISVFFHHQYFTNRLISDFDFWRVIGMNKRNKAH